MHDHACTGPTMAFYYDPLPPHLLMGNWKQWKWKWKMEIENGNDQNLMQMNLRLKPVIKDHLLYKDHIAIRFQRWLRYIAHVQRPHSN